MAGESSGVHMVAIRVREERQKQKLGVNELARKARIYPSALHALESGKSVKPRFETVFALAKALGVSIDWLSGISKTKEPQP